MDPGHCFVQTNLAKPLLLTDRIIFTKLLANFLTIIRRGERGAL